MGASIQNYLISRLITKEIAPVILISHGPVIQAGHLLALWSLALRFVSKFLLIGCHRMQSTKQKDNTDCSVGEFRRPLDNQ